ncbi:MAG: acetamidase/formamidase family protein, partial [Armatimonadota bacterium]|nr:acetamidase/formamidase family protein [Armatimonadota bacterium]
MAIHSFKPDHYYASLGTYPPVLRIADGDSVLTSTVDASGRDLEGNHLASGPNPQTGPFYIEGAEPGDTLRVSLDKLWPNRPSGFSSTSISPNVVDPSYVSELPTPRGRAEWELDLEAGTATLAAPVTKLGRLTLPMQPMLGCFGVAPPLNQAISAATSSTHGGNMDYKRFVQGVTVYFPVFVEGALFFVGDGHAIQGDGEIAGTGIETSFSVQFTVHILK